MAFIGYWHEIEGPSLFSGRCKLECNPGTLLGVYKVTLPMNRDIFFITLLYLLGCSDSKQFPVAAGNNEGLVTESRSKKIGGETYTTDYGTITVPENRNNPSSRLINIPFLRIHSKADHPAEPVFGLGGGPGNSNLSWDLEFASLFLPERDFVLVGYRGVDGSVRLDCPEVVKALSAVDDPLSENSMKKIGNGWTQCAARISREGTDLNGYTMPECIEDIEFVRSRLGYDRINLLSRSYGTRVAYLYGLQHPEQIFRSVMIGVNPPGHFVWEPGVTDEQLKHYAALWSKDPSMMEASPDLYATIRNELANPPGSWMGFSINPGKLKIATFFLLYHRKTAAMVFDAYVAAGHGDASGLALMSLTYDFVVPTLMTWGDLASKGVSADFDSTRNYTEGMNPSGMPLGAPGTHLLWGPLTFGRWPVKMIPERLRKLQPSQVETLLLNGSIDFSTPAQFGVNELMPVLKNGKQIVLAEYGHVDDVLKVHSENTRLLLTSFYNTGKPDTFLNTDVPMDFRVKWGFSTMAKVGLLLAGLLITGFILVVYWLMRRLRRRLMR